MADRSPTLGDIAARLDRSAIRRLLVERFDAVGVGFGSLARIGVFAIAWLVVLGLVVTTPEADTAEFSVNRVDATPDEIARSVTLDRSDQRGFAVNDRGQGLRVAWVGGSTLQEIPGNGPFRFIPGLIADSVRLDSGSAVDVDLYFLEAARIVDTYVATLEALSTKPDVLVVALNPVLVFNGAAVQTWDNLDGLLADLALSDPGALPLAASLVSPSDVAWGLAGRHLEVIEGRWHWSERFNEWPTVGSILDPDLSSDADESGVLEDVATMSLPIDFWIAYGADSTDETKTGRQLAMLETADDYDDRVNEIVLGLLAAAITDSGIPTILYVPPVRTEVDQAPWLAATLADVEQRLEGFEADFAAGHVRFDPHSLDIPLEVLDHVDLLHVRNGTPVAAEIADRLCALLDDLGGVRCVDTEEETS